MKDLGLMHYFLGLEVWESPKKIFLNQGKYAVEILKRFDMLECKSMNTPMETKLKLLVDTSSELVDATLYRQIIGSDEQQAKYMFCCKHLESISGINQDVFTLLLKNIWWDTLRVCRIFVSIILEIMTSYWVVTPIQIEMEVLLIKISLQDVVSIWG